MSPDEQEAKSLAYNCARIVRLTSGNFALLSPFSPGSEVIEIGSWSALEHLVPTSDELSTWHQEESYRPTDADIPAAKSLLETLGLAKPKLPIKRRF